MKKQNQSDDLNKKNLQKSMNNSKTISPLTLIISVLILFVATVIGLGIRNFRLASVEKENITNDIQHVEIPKNPELEEIEHEPAMEEIYVEYIPEPEPEPEPQNVSETVSSPTPSRQVRVEREPTQDNPTYNQWTEQPELQIDEERVAELRQWASWYGNLPTEEKQQLIQGLTSDVVTLFQRWQYMPPEQVQAEREQMVDTFRQWMDAPTEDRQQGIQNIQQQLEQWLYYQQGY